MRLNNKLLNLRSSPFTFSLYRLGFYGFMAGIWLLNLLYLSDMDPVTLEGGNTKKVFRNPGYSVQIN